MRRGCVIYGHVVALVAPYMIRGLSHVNMYVTLKTHAQNTAETTDYQWCTGSRCVQERPPTDANDRLLARLCSMSLAAPSMLEDWPLIQGLRPLSKNCGREVRGWGRA
jgi:hypothetical protein